MGVIKRSKFKHVSPEEFTLREMLENGELSPPEDNQEQPPVPEVRHPLPPILPQRRVNTNPNPQVTRNANKNRVQEEKFPKGHKKRRRYENNKYLLNLASLEDASDPVFTESRSAFTELLQEKDKMAAWKAFLAFDEDDQFAILANNEVFAYFNNESVLEETKVVIRKKISEIREARRKLNADQAFRCLQSKIKSIFSKRHFPMGILQQLENEIVSFFTETPQATYIIERSCSFDRLIVHAICHFNILLSQSFTTEDNRRQTHIRNWGSDFFPPTVSLSEYIQSMRV